MEEKSILHHYIMSGTRIPQKYLQCFNKVLIQWCNNLKGLRMNKANPEIMIIVKV